MPSSTIPKLVALLRAFRPTNNVANPYRSRGCRTNLAAYLHGLLQLPYSGHLLVGEAPGYRGCALTGIPFTSERLLARSDHPFLIGLRKSLVIHGTTSEPTATIVWEYFGNSNKLPAFWNIFPFHPHRAGDSQSNRLPTSAEAAAGRPFLEMMLELLYPRRVVAVGRTAAKWLAKFFPTMKMDAVPHPSHGNKAAFIAGLKVLRMNERDHSHERMYRCKEKFS